MASGEGLVFNLDCVSNGKLSTAARAITNHCLFFSYMASSSSREWSAPTPERLARIRQSGTKARQGRQEVRKPGAERDS